MTTEDHGEMTTIAGMPYDDYVAAFIQHYCVAMLWANTHVDDDDGTQDVDPYQWMTPSATWAIDAFDEDSQASIRGHCEDFVKSAADLLSRADQLHYTVTLYTEDGKYGPEQAGHDFALTRNGHGAGFWDRGLGEIGVTLTNMAKVYGDSTAWIHADDDPASDNLAHLD